MPPSAGADPVLAQHRETLEKRMPSLKWIGHVSTAAVYGGAQQALLSHVGSAGQSNAVAESEAMDDARGPEAESGKIDGAAGASGILPDDPTRSTFTGLFDAEHQRLMSQGLEDGSGGEGGNGGGSGERVSEVNADSSGPTVGSGGAEAGGGGIRRGCHCGVMGRPRNNTLCITLGESRCRASTRAYGWTWMGCAWVLLPRVRSRLYQAFAVRLGCSRASLESRAAPSGSSFGRARACARPPSLTC